MKKSISMYRTGIAMFVISLTLLFLIVISGSISFEKTPIRMILLLLNCLMMILSVVIVNVSGLGNNEVRFEEAIYDLFKRKKKSNKKVIKTPKNVYDLIYIDHEKRKIRSNLKKSFDLMYSIKSEYKGKQKEMWISFQNEVVNVTLQISKKHNYYFVIFDDRIESQIDNKYEQTNEYKLSVDYIYGVINGEDEITLPFFIDNPLETYEAIPDFVREKINRCNEVISILNR